MKENPKRKKKKTKRRNERKTFTDMLPHAPATTQGVSGEIADFVDKPKQ